MEGAETATMGPVRASAAGPPGLAVGCRSRLSGRRELHLRENRGSAGRAAGGSWRPRPGACEPRPPLNSDIIIIDTQNNRHEHETN